MIRWVAAGAVLGGLLSSTPLWGELFDRLRWAAGSGAGERSDWGEPLFFAALLGVPGAVAGAVVGAIIFAVRRRRRESTQQR